MSRSRSRSRQIPDVKINLTVQLSLHCQMAQYIIRCLMEGLSDAYWSADLRVRIKKIAATWTEDEMEIFQDQIPGADAQKHVAALLTSMKNLSAYDVYCLSESDFVEPTTEMFAAAKNPQLAGLRDFLYAMMGQVCAYAEKQIAKEVEEKARAKAAQEKRLQASADERIKEAQALLNASGFKVVPKTPALVNRPTATKKVARKKLAA